MAKVRVQLTPEKDVRRNFELDKSDIGIKHLYGSPLCTFDTACGNVDTGAEYKDAKGNVTCARCLDMARVIINALSMKENTK